MANPPTFPSDGRITSLQNYTAAFTGGELFPVVAPGNATAGINYNVTASQVATGLLNVLPGGTAGYALISNGPASAPTFQGFTQLGANAVTRTWQSKNRDTINIRDFGTLVDDGVTDNRAIFQAAINATPLGGTLIVPVSTSGLGFGVGQSGTSSYCLTIVQPIQLRGLGRNSIILPLATVPATVDTINIVGSPSASRYMLDQLFIGNPVNGTRQGRHGLYFDTTATANSFQKLVVQNCGIYGSTGTGNAIYHTNSTTNNPNGGLFASDVRENILEGGVSLNGSGDSITIQDNLMSGINAGVYVNLAPSAGNIVVVKNNITNVGGAVVIDNAISGQIAFNQAEQQATTTESNNAMIDLNGGSGALGPVAIWCNQIQSLNGTTVTIRVNNASGASIRGNRIGYVTPSIGIAVASSASNTFIGADNTYLSISQDVSNSGIGTIYETGSQTFSRVSVQFNSATTTLANVPGLSVSLATGGNYFFEGTLYTQSGSTSGIQVGINGGATCSSFIYEGMSFNAGTVLTQQIATGSGPGVNATVVNATSATGALVRLSGTIQIANGGTLLCQFAQQTAAAATSIILAGSSFNVFRLA